MTITPADIKLLASERMTDQEDGGGAMTGTALQDGAENEVFPDISSTDRAFGRLALRKVYGAVLNAGTDTLLGAHAILNAVPTDADVGAWMLAGTDTSESRADVALRLAQLVDHGILTKDADADASRDADHEARRARGVRAAGRHPRVVRAVGVRARRDTHQANA